MKLKCKRKGCGYAWDYKGKSKFYATCPNCLNKVKIAKGDAKL
jgi:hypothetical protein